MKKTPIFVIIIEKYSELYVWCDNAWMVYIIDDKYWNELLIIVIQIYFIVSKSSWKHVKKGGFFVGWA